MILTPLVRWKSFNLAGTAALAGGKVHTYIAGTTTPQATYTDAAGGTPNANPVILDANGEANIWLDPTLTYKIVLGDSSDATQWTVDNITGLLASGIPQWNGTVTYSQGAIVADASGSGLLYVSLTNGNLNNALTSVANWRVFQGNIVTKTTNYSIVVTDDVVRSNSTAGALTHTLPACSTTPIGKELEVKDVGTGGFTTSVKGAGADNVDGSNTYGVALNGNDAIRVKNNGTSWDVIAVFLNKLGKLPTIQKFTSGSAQTYTTPSGCRYIRVRMVGGGGGGGGLAAGSSNGGAGGDTSFGTTLLVAKGGSLGQAAGSPGVATSGSSLGTGPIGFVIEGAGGGPACGSAANTSGGNGGSSAFGGAGSGGIPGVIDATAATTNSGSGGGGGENAGASGAGGGGAGAYVDAIITGPAATYTYTVGAAGAAGAGAHPGGAGGAGLIIVEEHYY